MWLLLSHYHSSLRGAHPAKQQQPRHTDGEFWINIDCASTGVPHVTFGTFEILFPLRTSVLSVSPLFRLAAAIRGGVLIQKLGEAGKLHGTAVV